MTLPIEFHRMIRVANQPPMVTAQLGDLSRNAHNRTEAKKLLEEAIIEQLQHLRVTVLCSPYVVFVLFYRNGWVYEIHKTNRTRSGAGATLFGDTISFQEALDSTRRHFERYVVGCESELGIDRTDGEYRAALDAWNAEMNDAARCRIEAAEQAHIAAYYAARGEKP